MVEIHTCSLLSSCPHYATSIPASFASLAATQDMCAGGSPDLLLWLHSLLFSDTSDLSSCFSFSQPSQLSFSHPLSQYWFCFVQQCRASITHLWVFRTSYFMLLPLWSFMLKGAPLKYLPWGLVP